MHIQHSYRLVAAVALASLPHVIFRPGGVSLMYFNFHNCNLDERVEHQMCTSTAEANDDATEVNRIQFRCSPHELLTLSPSSQSVHTLQLNGTLLFVHSTPICTACVHRGARIREKDFENNKRTACDFRYQSGRCRALRLCTSVRPMYAQHWCDAVLYKIYLLARRELFPHGKRL